MDDQLLDEKTFNDVVERARLCGLCDPEKRGLLVPSEVEGHLPDKKVPLDQLLSDLKELNSRRWPPHQGAHPLVRWLEAANRLLRGRRDADAAFFMDIARRCTARAPDLVAFCAGTLSDFRARLDTYEPELHVDRAHLHKAFRDFLDSGEPLLLVEGSPGSGKTSSLVRLAESFSEAAHLIPLCVDETLDVPLGLLAHRLFPPTRRWDDETLLRELSYLANRSGKCVILLVDELGDRDPRRARKVLDAWAEASRHLAPSVRLAVFVETTAWVEMTRERRRRARFAEIGACEVTRHRGRFVVRPHESLSGLCGFDLERAALRLFDARQIKGSPVRGLDRSISSPRLLRLVGDMYRGQWLPERLTSKAPLDGLLREVQARSVDEDGLRRAIADLARAIFEAEQSGPRHRDEVQDTHPLLSVEAVRLLSASGLVVTRQDEEGRRWLKFANYALKMHVIAFTHLELDQVIGECGNSAVMARARSLHEDERTRPYLGWYGVSAPYESLGRMFPHETACAKAYSVAWSRLMAQVPALTNGGAAQAILLPDDGGCDRPMVGVVRADARTRDSVTWVKSPDHLILYSHRVVREAGFEPLPSGFASAPRTEHEAKRMAVEDFLKAFETGRWILDQLELLPLHLIAELCWSLVTMKSSALELPRAAPGYHVAAVAKGVEHHVALEGVTQAYHERAFYEPQCQQARAQGRFPGIVYASLDRQADAERIKQLEREARALVAEGVPVDRGAISSNSFVHMLDRMLARLAEAGIEEIGPVVKVPAVLAQRRGWRHHPESAEMQSILSAAAATYAAAMDIHAGVCERLGAVVGHMRRCPADCEVQVEGIVNWSHREAPDYRVYAFKGGPKRVRFTWGGSERVTALHGDLADVDQRPAVFDRIVGGCPRESGSLRTLVEGGHAVGFGFRLGEKWARDMVEGAPVASAVMRWFLRGVFNARREIVKSLREVVGLPPEERPYRLDDH